MSASTSWAPKAHLAFLTTPLRGVYVLNIQLEGSSDVLTYEVSKGQLANILIDGTTLALRDVDNRSREEPRG